MNSDEISAKVLEAFELSRLEQYFHKRRPLTSGTGVVTFPKGGGWVEYLSVSPTYSTVIHEIIDEPAAPNTKGNDVNSDKPALALLNYGLKNVERDLARSSEQIKYLSEQIEDLKAQSTHATKDIERNLAIKAEYLAAIELLTRRLL